MGTFSVLEAITGRTYPEDDVTIYTDQKAAYEAYRLDVKMGDVTDPSELDTLVEQHKALVDQVKASALTFHMQGLPSEVRDALNKANSAEFGEGADTTESRRALSYDTLAAHIVRVTDAQGNVDESKWNRESVGRLIESLHDESYPRFYDAMNKLTMQAAYFEGVEVSPDFS